MYLEAGTAPELSGQRKLHVLPGSEQESHSGTTLKSLLLLAMRGGGRFPGLSPNCPTQVPTQHRTQDPSSIPRAFVSAPPPQLTSSRSPGSQGREGETRPSSASNSPGDLDEVTARSRPTS